MGKWKWYHNGIYTIYVNTCLAKSCLNTLPLIYVHTENNDTKILEDRFNGNLLQHKIATILENLQANMFFLAGTYGTEHWLIVVCCLNCHCIRSDIK